MPETKASPFEVMPETNKEALQRDADALFLERVSLIFPNRLGRFALRGHDIINRNADDITNIDTYFLAADLSHTQAKITAFQRQTANHQEVRQKFDDTLSHFGLEAYPNVMIVSPHTKMDDILGLAYVSLTSHVLDARRTAADNYMYLSRLIGYTDLKLPLRKQRSVVEREILPLCNVVQVFPETKSLEPLRKKYESTIRRANGRAQAAALRHQRQKKDPAQQLMFIAPTGSQMKKHKHGKKIEPISETTITMLYNSYIHNTPVLVAGFELNFIKAKLWLPEVTLPFRGDKFDIKQQHIAFGVEEPIMPEQHLSREQFESTLKQRLLWAARKVSKKPVYA